MLFKNEVQFYIQTYINEAQVLKRNVYIQS